MLGLVEFWLRVILDPATSPKAVEDAVLTVPEVVPPAIELIVVRTDCPARGLGPITVIAGLVEFWLRVMLEPAKKANAVEDAVFAVPLVTPPAAEVIDTKADWLLAEIVIELAPVARDIFAPADRMIVPVLVAEGVPSAAT
jgi:hypothetical protein